MFKYLSKFFLEILPSVVATVVGAYIVNHYISPKPPYPPTEAPRAAAVAPVASQPPGQTGTADTPAKPATVREAKPELKLETKQETAKTEPKTEPKTDPKTDPKGRAASKGDKPPVDKSTEQAKSDTTGKGETEGRRFVIRDKATDKPPVDKPAPATVEAVAAPATEDHPDAAELARAALERLRTSEPASRPAEPAAPAVAVREPPREPVREQAREQAHANVTAVPSPPSNPATPPVIETHAAPPLPPPVSVATPMERTGSERNGFGSDAPKSGVRSADADRLVPPADIPGPPPLDLAAPKKKSVAEDMLSAARSVFQSVVPQ